MNNFEIIKRLNELFEESIIELPDEEILEYVEKNPNPAFDKHLAYIKKLRTKALADKQKNISTKAKELLQNFMSELGDSTLLNSLLTQPKYQQLIPSLFSKFEGISEGDKESMLKDKKLMELIQKLKKDIENEQNTTD